MSLAHVIISKQDQADILNVMISLENDDKENHNGNSNNWQEYACISQFLAKESKYSEHILFNNQTTKENKIKLNDIFAQSFECIRDWCHSNSSNSQRIRELNVLGVLIASFKYQINKLLNQCISYIPNEWITDGESLVNLSTKCNDTTTNITIHY